MVFKKIELYGFKSFADKLEVDFSGGITCIVGPNGCGKSNVSDAVRWVLGEQSSRVLRGTSMQDVIFKGTERRNSLSYCEVALHFDNTAKTFPVDYSEVVLSRKLYRSGESEYSINRKTARLKDIKDLLHDTGIDRDGFTIISQGQVAEIINSKPESRRGIFEEAAGIAKYKSRKDEAERKLERTQENLTRVNDVVSEIERTLGPLLKQAANAEKYIELRDKLKILEINAYIYQYDAAAGTKAELQRSLDELSAQLQNAQRELNSLTADTNASLDEISNLDKKAEAVREQVLALSLELERASGEKRLVQEKLNLLLTQDADVQSEILIMNDRLEKERIAQEECKQLHTRLTENADELRSQLSTLSIEYAQKIEKLRALEETAYQTKPTDAAAKLEASIRELSEKRAQLHGKRAAVQGLIDSGEGYKFSVRKLIEAKNKESEIARNIVGVVAQEITVPQHLETAIEVALGAAAQNIITESEDNARALINTLSARNWGRATFLPITSVNPRELTHDEEAVVYEWSGGKQGGGAVLGVASRLITHSERVSRVISNLLGRVAVVTDLEAAINFARRMKYALKIVTLDGDVIEPRGSITGGSKNALNNNLWHTNTLAEIDKQLADLDVRIAAETEKLSAAQETTAAETTAARSEYEAMKTDTDKSHLALTEVKIKAAALESELFATDARLNAYVNTTLMLEKNISDKRAQLSAINKNIKTANDGADIDQDQRDYSVRVQQLENAKADLASFDGRKEHLHTRLAELEAERAKQTANSQTLQEDYFKIELRLSKVDSDIQTMQDRIYEEYGLNYSSCYMFRVENFDVEPALDEIANLKKAIARLGNVNLSAIEDSKESKQRYDSYRDQTTDLEAAKADLLKVIKDLSAEMEERFKHDFQIINHNFQVVFRELFGGGNAKLVLTDTGDWLGSGIDIVAEPPGKKLQNITLLSGGEKALTAIAILFAILKLRPMPFCLLDEIEAALDDANVGRFASYLQKFSQSTQFIVITHRKPTMELADNLYGVTMEEKGVSKLVSVKLESWAGADTESVSVPQTAVGVTAN